MCGIFVLTGVVNTLLGPMLPEAVRLWRLSTARAGAFFPAQFIAAMAGALLMARVAARLGLPGCFAASFAAMAAGVAAAGAGGPLPALAGVCCFGFGLGLNIPAANCLAARLAPGGPEAAVTQLNLAWGMGAILGPAAVSPAFAAWSLRPPLVALGAALLAAAAIAARLARHGGFAPGAPSAGASHPCKPPPRSFVLLAASFLFVYVGAENCLSGWLPLLARRAHGVAQAEAGVFASAFWAALLGVRAAVPLALVRCGAGRLMGAGLLLFLAGSCSAAAASSGALLLAGAAAAGAGLGPLFPLTVARFHHYGGAGAERKMGLVFAGASLGGACIPPMVGVVGEFTGALARGFAVVPAMGLLMLWLRVRIVRYETAASGGIRSGGFAE